MGRYSKVYRRMWNDEKFRRLSLLKPSGQGLWLYLLTCTENQNIPGLFEAREVAMADKLRWDLEAFRYAFQEASNQGMVEADWEVGLVWLPKGIHHNKPESINVVKSWGNTWDDLPECELKTKAYQYLLAFLEGIGDAFQHAFAKACAKACAIQEQEQEHIQEQNIDESNDSNFLPKKTSNQKSKNKADRLKQKKKTINARPTAHKLGRGMPAKTKPILDLDSDLFALSDSARDDVLKLLNGNKKGDVDKKPVLDVIERLVLRAYSAAKEKHTGSGYAPAGKHTKVSAQKIGIGCLSYKLKPEQVIEYWVEHNFTGMRFPTLLFVSSDKNMETAAYGLDSGPNRKKNGYIPADKNFEDDSECDNEELLLLAEQFKKEDIEKEKQLAIKKAEEAKRVDEWFAKHTEQDEETKSDEKFKDNSKNASAGLQLHAKQADREDAERRTAGTTERATHKVGHSASVARGRRKDADQQ